MNRVRLQGLVAATHTPFASDGSLNLAIIEAQAAHLLKHRVETAFIGGTTGEWSSLTFQERQALSERWFEVARGSALKVIVHVGANCLADACGLAEQAQQRGTFAISALAPSYFKPASIPLLVDAMGEIAMSASETPFYYYDISSLTGVAFAPSTFLDEASSRIPTLAGIKFTSHNLIEYQLCATLQNRHFDIPFGIDEMLLAALSLGAVGAVGSTYNFAAPIYHRMIQAFSAGDLPTARTEQFRSVQLVTLLARYGYMAAAKEVMKILGVDVGPPRLPNSQLGSVQKTGLRQGLEALGFFDWIP